MAATESRHRWRDDAYLASIGAAEIIAELMQRDSWGDRRSLAEFFGSKVASLEASSYSNSLLNYAEEVG
jgi:hypothetical protein